ncbi:hypothetical protein [Caballeronia sordidicola]|uniref:hypothetical protein n=1 Tax=Caballeronia sordidicola TaxID=196367 RepID=UPI0004CFFEF9|nr:hypothetical protein [Caballeronia sordidicola]
MLLLFGCSTTSGPTPIVNKDGAISQPASSGLTAAFISMNNQALQDYNSNAGAQLDSSQRMLASGLALVASNCSEFFASAAQNQKWIIFSRDTVGAVGTLATSILSLTSASKTAVSAVAIGTGAGFTGLDLYSKDFLFSAENISSVRDLTMTALKVHRAAALKAAPATYPDVVLALQYNQDLCTPMRIASLVRQAIATGHVSADGSDSQTSPITTQDIQIASDLGKSLNPPGPLKGRQITALWWLFQGTPTVTEMQLFIYPILNSMSVTKGNAENWYRMLNDTAKTDINSELNKLSAGKEQTINERIAEQRQEEVAFSKAQEYVADAQVKASSAQSAAANAIAASAPDAVSAAVAADAAATMASAAAAAAPKQPPNLLLNTPDNAPASNLSHITVTIH